MKIKWTRNYVIFLIMGIVYITIEVAFTAIVQKSWRLVGHSSIWMFFIGGFLGYILGILNEISFIRKNFNIFFQTLLGTGIIIIVELITGMILNMWLKFDLWDYSHEIFNLWGQMSLPHTIGWFLLSPLVFWIDDMIRYFVYNEGKSYSLWKLYAQLFKIFGKAIYYENL